MQRFGDQSWQMTIALRLNHISLRVRNLGVSSKFYQDVLLLKEIKNGTGAPNIRWFAIGQGQSVHLIEGDFGNTFVTIATHFCISSAQFDRTLQHLTNSGVGFCNLTRDVGKEHVRADGIRSVYLQDPDGYWIEINEDY